MVGEKVGGWVLMSGDDGKVAWGGGVVGEERCVEGRVR